MKKTKLLIPLGLLLLTVMATTTAYAFQGWGNGEKPNCDPAEMQARQEQMAAVQEAINNNDYQAWLALVDGQPITQTINEENFSRFVEMHQLMNQVQQIQEELGLNQGHRGFGFMKGFHQPPDTESEN